MDLHNPLLVKFTNGRGKVSVNNGVLVVPTFTNWSEFTGELGKLMGTSQYDYVLLGFDKSLDDAGKQELESVDIKINAVIKNANKRGLLVFNRFEGKNYAMNLKFRNRGESFAMKDEDVLEKLNRFDGEESWQKHQADVWKRVGAVMPLSDGSFNRPDHLSILTHPSRGLKKENLEEFFSWTPDKVLIPGLVKDDLVGMPSIRALVNNDINLFYQGKSMPGGAITLVTSGLPGAIIPMKNANGDMAKFQIAADVTKFNVKLQARAADGVSIMSSEIYDKKNKVYKFTDANGEPLQLTVDSASNDKVTFSDRLGTFDANIKENIFDRLRERGYVIPELISSLNVIPASKYIWPGKGFMVGSDVSGEAVTPSQAGFIVAKEPPAGSDKYVVLVAEGALKGVITAEYLDAKDANGNSFADLIAKNYGVIVAQVPGVSPKFIDSVARIFDKYNVIGTYVAYDADGRSNLEVCRGIHYAYNNLVGMDGDTVVRGVKVLSWDPAQKGIDDALLAVARHEITVEDMGVHFGSPDRLFPMENAKAPNPYRLDGSRANRSSWELDHEEAKAERAAKVAEAQERSGLVESLSELDGFGIEP